MDTLYRSVLEQPLLHTAARGGEWVSPMQAVFSAPTAEGDAAARAMHGALLRSGMPLVHVPASVVSLLQSAARSAGVALQTADAPTVRRWLLGAEARQSGLSREEGLALLAHCHRTGTAKLRSPTRSWRSRNSPRTRKSCGACTVPPRSRIGIWCCRSRRTPA